MFDRLVSDLSSKLTGKEWSLVSYYVLKADDLGKSGSEDAAREALQSAVDVANSKCEYNTEKKIRYYIRFY